jgi:hypothetical protein
MVIVRLQHVFQPDDEVGRAVLAVILFYAASKGRACTTNVELGPPLGGFALRPAIMGLGSSPAYSD